jgi:hypothetical protein
MTLGRSRSESLAALVLCATFGLLVAIAAHHRVIGGYGVETDFYRAYAPDASRILEGAMPAAGKNPPGYSALLAAAHPVTGDHFVSGKWLAVATAMLTGWVAFSLFRLLFGGPAALLGCAVTLASEAFATHAIQATTDMPFLLATVAAMRVVLDERLPAMGRAPLGGLLTGLACLVRLNGLFLVPPVALAIGWLQGAGTPIGRRLLPIVLFLAVGLATVTPWLALDRLQHGSVPGATLHEDAAKAFYGRRDAKRFDSFLALVASHPTFFAATYARKLISNLGLTLAGGLITPPASLLALAGLVLALRARRRPVLVGLFSIAALVALMALTVWRTRFYLWVGVCYAGLAAWATMRLADWLGARWRAAPRRPVLVAILALALLVPAVAASALAVQSLLRHEPRQILAAAEFLRQRPDSPTGVASYKPHLPYHAGLPWRRLEEVRTLPEMEALVRAAGVRYVVYERAAEGSLPVLRGLRPSARTPSWLRPIYSDRAGQLVIYEVTG